MKALLVNIDLMVRVIVSDNATEEEIIEAAVEKASFQAEDKSWFSEGVTDWKDDNEVPFGSATNDKPNPEFMNLAEHLKDLIRESDDWLIDTIENANRFLAKPPLSDKTLNKIIEAVNARSISENTIYLTAFDLQRGYVRHMFDKKENGAYYYSGMTDDYGGRIETELYKIIQEEVLKVYEI